MGEGLDVKLVCPPDHDDLRQDITICMGFLGYDVKSQYRSMCDRLPGCGFILGFLYCGFHGGVLDRTLDEYWGCGLNWGAVIFRDFTVAIMTLSVY